MKRVLFAGFVLLGVLSLVAYAETVDLDQIIVTPYRYGETLSKTAGGVTVISARDIRDSNAGKVVDVLRAVPGITVRDLYGNGTKAVVDMAGFGEQAALNVLVLVDGRRVNDVDLSGVDWGQVPIEQVERIEVIRGGSAGVLYGDNASSGVINVITKKGAGAPRIDVGTEYGSYDKNVQKISVSGGKDQKFSYWFSGGRDSTNGYRGNSFSKSSDLALRLEYHFTDVLSTHLYSGLIASTYGMPGALFGHQIDENGRRFARYGKDHANNKDSYVVWGITADFNDRGVLEGEISYRNKKTDSYFLTSGNPILKNDIETVGITPKYTLKTDVMGHENKFITGVDIYRSFYRSNAYLCLDENNFRNYTRVGKDSLAGYVNDELSLTDALTATGGYRYEKARYAFGYHDFDTTTWGHPYPDQDKKITPQQKAFNTGLVYTYKEDSSVFMDIGQSFRFPQVDEFTYQDSSYQQQLDTTLRPQSSLNYQIGLRHRFSDDWKASASVFRMNVKDEIYFNFLPISGAGQNSNYGRTVHEGLELSVENKIISAISWSGNYTFTNAFFDGGDYAGQEIPLAARHKASASLKFDLSKDIALSIVDTYVGKRYASNDLANSQSRVNGYMVVDANLSWRLKKDCWMTLGVNNFFNRQYSEYAGYNMDSSNGFALDKFYYPSPERNYSLKVNYTF